MSRRMRLEIEATKNIKNEQDDEEDVYKTRRERIFAPVVWQTLNNGIVIHDIKLNKIPLALELLEKYFLPFEDLGRNVDIMEDEQSVRYSLKKLKFCLRDETSLFAVTPNEQVVGILVLKVYKKADYTHVYNRVQIFEGEALRKCVEVTNYLMRKANVFEHFKCDSYLRYHGLCILPNFRGKGLGFTMMKCGVSVARSMDLPVIMGIFTNWKLQKLATRLGMKVLKEVNYVNWKDKDDELIFSDPGAGNYTIAAMGGLIPKAPPKPRVIPPEIIEMEKEESKHKKTRIDRRNELIQARLYTKDYLIKT